jgi:hypothetical protein
MGAVGVELRSDLMRIHVAVSDQVGRAASGLGIG